MPAISLLSIVRMASRSVLAAVRKCFSRIRTSSFSGVPLTSSLCIQNAFSRLVGCKIPKPGNMTSYAIFIYSLTDIFCPHTLNPISLSFLCIVDYETTTASNPPALTVKIACIASIDSLFRKLVLENLIHHEKNIRTR